MKQLQHLNSEILDKILKMKLIYTILQYRENKTQLQYFGNQFKHSL